MSPFTRLKCLCGAAIVALGLPFTLTSPAFARMVVNCGGAALAGGAQLLCSHADPRSPAQLCTFSWALATMANDTQVVSGTFLLPPGASNVTVYQGIGFAHAQSDPIVMCQGKHVPPRGKFQ
jgi:hypothetical protein